MKLIKFGDILSVKSGIIVHGCNAQGVMGSGLALAIKNMYPEVYAHYIAEMKHAPDNKAILLGSAQVVNIKSNPNLVIVNGITQERYGRDGKKYVSYQAIHSVFSYVNILAKSRGLDVHYPMIGAGLGGGGDWAVISEIIDTVFYESEVKRTLWINE